MARVVSRSRPRSEGSTSIKFTELVVIGMVLLMIGGGVRYYMNYLHSPTAALKNYFDDVKHGDVAKQYDLLDDDDKAKYLPTKHDYASQFKQAHGYTERVVDVTVDPYTAAPDAVEVTLNATVDILQSGGGKELYEGATSKGYTDKYVMRKSKDGEWKLVLSKTLQANNGKLNLMDASPTPDSTY